MLCVIKQIDIILINNNIKLCFQQESMFLRTALYVLTSLTTMSIFGSALATSHLLPAVDNIPIVPDRNLYAKVRSLR